MSAKTATQTEVSAILVNAYVDLATNRNSSSWEFFYLAKDFSVRIVKDSIKQAQKESGLNLPDLTPTKAQHFATLSAIQDKFSVSEILPFSKAISLAYRADETLKAEGARSLVESSASLEEFTSAIPKTSRKAGKTASEKSEGFAGEVVEADPQNIGDLLLSMAESMTPEERITFAKQITATAKLISKMESVTA